jgi:pantetheine-phosphate adenylyltransferase
MGKMILFNIEFFFIICLVYFFTRGQFMKTIAIYPGTFDPLTTGHLDIIRRSGNIFSQTIVAIAETTHKHPLFSLKERQAMIKAATKDLERVTVDKFSGLLVDYMRSCRAQVIIRGLRAIADFEYEFQMAQMNRKLFPAFEIVYMMPDERYTFVSSTLAKEIAALGGDVNSLIPEASMALFTKKFMTKKSGKEK